MITFLNFPHSLKQQPLYLYYIVIFSHKHALTCGRASRSVERMKKWPWKWEILRPLLQRIRITPSHAAGRDTDTCYMHFKRSWDMCVPSPQHVSSF